MRHGLRVSEAIALRWDQVDLKQGRASVTMTTDAESQQVWELQLAY